jgi:hypothetical protein
MSSFLKFCYHNWYAFSVGIIFIFMFGSTFLKSKIPQIRLLGMIAMLWPLGKVLQFTHTGTPWMRNYISDLGFVTAIGLFVLYHNINTIKKGTKNVYDFKLRMQMGLVLGITLGFILAVIAETGQFALDFMVMQQNGALKNNGVSRGDINDYMAYTISGIVSIIIVYRMETFPRCLKQN